MTQADTTSSTHRWRFFRSGGFDQVALQSGEDLLNLRTLDPKLWTVLSCPARGLEFDQRTLELMDTDGDGQIRVPEILAAVEWACAVLKDPGVLFRGGDLALEWIDESHPEGAAILAAARRSLAYLGKPDATSIGVDDFADPTRLFTPDHFNGDGVAPPELAPDEDLRRVIVEILMTVGGAPDRSGAQGITIAEVDAFFDQAAAYLEWHDRVRAEAASLLPLGDATPAAAAALDAVRAKIDDYFARCRLAAFDARAEAALNVGEAVYAGFAERVLDTTDDAVAALPLTTVAAGRPLPLGDEINPAWADAIRTFDEQVVTPLLGDRDALSAAEWESLKAALEPYRQWIADRPETGVSALDPEHLREILGADTRDRLAELIERDRTAETSAATVLATERLTRYQRNLVTLLRNFVSLSDFYQRDNKAIFQAGTLYIDQRSCELVLRVPDMDRHAALAPFSGCFLVYCTCERKDEAPITIAAALTGGEVDELMVPGRHGLFVDRAGRDWKATVVKIVEQPVSIRQAFWAPYRRTARFVENQIRKFGEEREAKVEAATTEKIGEVTDNAGAAPTAAQAFDIAKFAGIFAAIGLAIGAIGTALAAIFANILELPWYLIPFALAGILLLISGPSMLLAYLTLRRRNIGPLLDANGWAVNARARINIPFGEALTGIAKLPSGASRSLVDPYADPKRPWKAWLAVAILLLALIVLWRTGALNFSVEDTPPAAVEEPAAPAE